MTDSWDDLNFLSDKNAELITLIGETILGVPRSELGSEYVNSVDSTVWALDDYLRKDIKTLLWLFNSRVTSIIIGRSFRKFSSMQMEDREKYILKWMKSRIPILRTAYTTLRSLCGWSYYSLQKSHPEMNYPGHTIGREHQTPTLLYGKEPWVTNRK
ncbi:MAG: hypothetical protein ACW98K_05125 [Candidatus Kariarchaeaceae archaeon]